MWSRHAVAWARRRPRPRTTKVQESGRRPLALPPRRRPILIALTGWLVAMVAFGGYAAQGQPAKSVFGPAQSYVVGATHLFGITVPTGDLDGDGDVDLAVTSEGTAANRTGGKLVVMENDGQGRFSPGFSETLLTSQHLASTAARCFSVGRGAAIVDVNNDGRNDVLAADAGSPQILPGPHPTRCPGWVVAFLNNGDGTFTRHVTETDPRPLGVGVADFNRDGKLDFLIDNEDVDTAQIFLGSGDGTFTERQTIDFTAGGPNPFCDSPHFPAAADLNADGLADGLIPCNNNGPIMFLPGNGDGTVGPPQVIDAGRANNFPDQPPPTPRRARPHTIAIDNFLGPGQRRAPDFAVANTGPVQPNPSVSVFINDPPGTFTEETASPYRAGDVPGARTSFIVSGQFTGIQNPQPDQRPDICVTSGFPNPGPQYISCFSNSEKTITRPDGSIVKTQFRPAPGSPFLITQALNFEDAIRELTAGDFNGDGKADIAVIDRGGADPQANRLGVLLHN
ncbi:MAG: FG-GAP repeat domain-containing protein [Nitriliruptorales bacterium]